jgi:4-hydroxy-tetrahydrodipicolinate synthase
MVRAAREGNLRAATTLHERYFALFKDLFIEPNPVPIKYALSLQGRMTPEVRLPLCEMSAANKARLTATLKNVGLAA